MSPVEPAELTAEDLEALVSGLDALLDVDSGELIVA